MKKSLLSIFAMATMLLATGCSQEEEILGVDSSDYVNASFTVDLNDGVQSRTLGEATLVNQLYFGVFQGETPVPVNADQAISEGYVADYVGEAVVTNKTATVKVRLVKGQTYSFVFWAQVKENTHYTIDQTNLKQITVNYGSDANDETRDAFFACVSDKVDSHFTKTVYLKRPFAQVNVGTTKADFEAAKVLLGEKPVTKSNMVVKNVPSTLNLLTGEVGNPTEATFKMAGLPKDTEAAADEYDILTVQDVDYAHLAMNYLLSDVKGEQEVVEAAIEFENEDGSINTINVTQLPIHRNYRTNIIGNILTTNGEFEVIVDNKFEGDEIRELWDGSSKKPEYDETTKTWSVGTPDELAWIADAVNGTLSSDARSLSTPKNFEGETVKLTADINLNNIEWTPIGHGGNWSEINFQGTFDGDGKTISNLKVTNTACAGLFGQMVKGTIKNVNVKNVTLNTNHYAGAIVAWVEQGGGQVTVSNCNVDGGSITVTPELIDGVYDNGDKAGGIVGFLDGGTVTGSSAKNLSIVAYRDLGGVVGHAEKATVTNNGVANVNLLIDDSHNYENYTSLDEHNANAIVGRVKGDENTINGNTGESDALVAEQKVVTTAVELQTALDAAKEGNNVISLAADITSTEPVVITEKQGVNIAIDGCNHKYDGQIKIKGQSHHGEETLLIKNINFESSTQSMDFIWSADSQNGSVWRYANNVTIENCTFTAVKGSKAEKTAVGVRFQQAYDIKLVGCTATNVHSLLQAESCGSNVSVEASKVINGKNGVSFNNTMNASISGTTIESVAEGGYGIRHKGEVNNYKLNVKDCTVSAFVPLLVRNMTGTGYNLTLEGTNELTTNSEKNQYQVVFCIGDYDGTAAPEMPTGTFTYSGLEGLKVFGLSNE